jgi:ubiquitin C-terminal hydrolase
MQIFAAFAVLATNVGSSSRGVGLRNRYLQKLWLSGGHLPQGSQPTRAPDDDWDFLDLYGDDAFVGPTTTTTTTTAAPVDHCTELCRLFPGEVRCGQNGSYCKGPDGHSCHDLYWRNRRSLCSRTSGEECPRELPIVSCADAEYFIQTKMTRPRMPSADMVPVGPRQEDSPTLGFGRRGFRNMHNTCYLSATLQLLAHSGPLRQLIRDAPMPEAAEGSIESRALGLVKDVFNQQWDTEALESDSGVPITPLEVLRILAEQRGYGFQLGQMEDAQDAIRTLLGLLEDAVRPGPGQVSPLTQLMSTTIRKERTCAACGGVRVYQDQVQDLFLPVPNVLDRPVTLAECFAAYFADEEIEGVACEGGACDVNARPNAVQSSSFSSTPEVLLVSLKRFTYREGRARRINAHIEVPLQINLAELPGGGEGVYRLTGVVHHMGATPQTGHYIADYIHPDDGFMYHADDSHVAPRNAGDLTGVTPYVLMYQRNP